MQPLKPCDDLFWFRRPKILIKLIHFILFQNAFELAFFFWALYTYGFSSCLMGKRWMVITRLGIGAFVQILCSSSTLPLYALVSLMGTTFRETILKEGTLNAILAWQEQATKKTAPKNKSGCHSGGHCLGGIMGLNKTKDGEGHIPDIALLGHHTQPHGNGHGHPHEQPHTHHDEPHNIEIHQGPLVIIQASEPSNLKEHDNESQVPPNATSSKPSSFSSVAILALEKNRRERQGLSKYSD